MVRGQSWRALSGVAGTRRLLADMKDAQRPVRAKRMNVHVSNRIFRPDDVTKRQSGWLREILGPEGCPRTCFKTVTKRSNAKKIEQSRAKTDKLARSVAGSGTGAGAGTGTGTGAGAGAGPGPGSDARRVCSFWRSNTWRFCPELSCKAS
jgi:hypothetical protein